MNGAFGRGIVFDLLVHNDNAVNAPDRETRNLSRKALGMAPEDEFECGDGECGICEDCENAEFARKHNL